MNRTALQVKVEARRKAHVLNPRPAATRAFLAWVCTRPCGISVTSESLRARQAFADDDAATSRALRQPPRHGAHCLQNGEDAAGQMSRPRPNPCMNFMTHEADLHFDSGGQASSWPEVRRQTFHISMSTACPLGWSQHHGRQGARPSCANFNQLCRLSFAD